MSDLSYYGEELDLFAGAIHWRGYWSSCVRPFLTGDVLEVGAGIGTNTRSLAPDKFRSWVCLEPDAKLADRAAVTLGANTATAECKVVVGTTETLAHRARFDTLLYIDVLEHIEDDKNELRRAAGLLKQGGQLIVLSPAHPWLYTAFDRSIGHYRRYNRASLLACGPEGCALNRIWYLDSVGMLASCANRFLLHQAMPDIRQILFWDRFLVRLSTLLDRLLMHRVGKSILAVWTKQ